MLKLVKFECQKQIKSFAFVIVLAIFTVFAFSQFREIFHLPVENEEDIKILDEVGVRDYIFVPATDIELKERTAEYLERMFLDGSISEEKIEDFYPVIEMLKDETYTFAEICAIMQDNEFVYSWLVTGKEQFSRRFGNVEEVKKNIQEGMGEKGYCPEFIKKYVTYMQLIASLLIFPLFLMLILSDYQSGIYEIVYSQPLSSTKHFISRFLSMFLPLVTYLYLLGGMFNFISGFRFRKEKNFSYTPLAFSFCIYVLPTVFFLCTFIMILMLLVRKAVAVFPIYIFYVIFIATPKAFGTLNEFFVGMNPIIRLDGYMPIPPIGVIIFNRFFYIAVGLLLLALSCRVYEKIRQDLKRVISL